MSRSFFSKFALLPVVIGAAASLSGCAGPSAGRVAVQQGDPARLRQILDQPNHGGEDVDSLLDDSVFDFNCAECARLLFKAGAKAAYNFWRMGGIPAGLDFRLASAASEGHAQVAQVLVDQGAEPTAAMALVRGRGGDGVRAAEEVFKKLEQNRSSGTAAPKPAAVRELSPNFAAAPRPDDLAVIVGIESYSGIDSKASYAESDAASFGAYVRALGVPERNIVLLLGPKAVRSALTKNLEGWLPRMAKPDSRVYFYFSGHGAPDVKTGQAYLVPWDGDPNYLEATAYPVAQLYQKLGELPVERVLVALDSCFSGAGGRSVLASGARPLVGTVGTGAAPPRVTVLSASASNETSGALDDKGHGAFTYFLLQGLDAGKTTPRTLVDYLTPRVQDEARRLNRDQTPQLQGDGSWSLR